MSRRAPGDQDRSRRLDRAPGPRAGHGRGVGDRPKRPDIAPANPAREGSGTVLIWGYHAVREALRSTRRAVVRLNATSGAIERLHGEIEARALTPVVVTADELSRRLPRDAVHQGVLLEAQPQPALDLADLPARGIVLVLDQVTDPHNVGAILRTAAAFGVAGLVTTERHAPDMTGVLAKAASGALEHVPIISVVNLARAMETLGDRGFFRVGLDSQGTVPLVSIGAKPALVLALGAEGKGLRRLTRQNCDVLARLDVPGPIKSLNVSNACAAALTMLHLRATQ